MGLEDKFYPEDGTLLTKVDNSIIKAAGKVGDAYQRVTGRGYEDLVKKSYFAAGCISLGTLIFPPMISITRQYFRFAEKPHFTTPLEEENFNMIMGLPKNQSRFMRLIVGITGIAATSLGYYFTSTSDNILSYYLSFTMFSSGLALIPATFADYLSISDVPKPPKKSVKDKVKGLFAIEPALEPISVLK
tara:strand:+ start:1299 stop:1865 length:567 start_codon:yes stop_codon:yes gene_type:complete